MIKILNLLVQKAVEPAERVIKGDLAIFYKNTPLSRQIISFFKSRLPTWFFWLL